MDALRARQGSSSAPIRPPVGDARFVPLADAKQALADAYRAYDEADANAWRNPLNGPRLKSDASGDEFSRYKPAGHYPLSGQDSRLVCTPVEDARAEAYRLYDEEMANAWRNPR
jgi:hypothetical protein